MRFNTLMAGIFFYFSCTSDTFLGSAIMLAVGLWFWSEDG